MAAFSTVANITGNGSVFAVSESGARRLLKVGDELQKGETIQTVGDVRVELKMEDGQALAVAPNQSIRLDENVAETEGRPTAQNAALAQPAATANTVIDALNADGDLLENLDATAAGLGATGGDGSGSSFVQLLRISEGVDPLNFQYSYSASDTPPIETGSALEADEVNVTLRYVEVDESGNPVLDQSGGYVYLDDTSVTEGTRVGFLVELDNPPSDSPLVLQLSDGNGNTVDLVIPVGESSGVATLDVRSDDLSAQAPDVYNISVTGASGGGYSAINVDQSTTLTVVDDNDVTVVNLEAPQAVPEGGSIVYSASVATPVAGAPLIITLSNGAIVTIPVGATSGSSEPVAVRPDDAYVQGDQNVTVSIASATGSDFEALDTSSTVTTVVSDDVDTTQTNLTTAEVTLGASEISEGGSITYSATVSNPVTESPLQITLSNGAVITIPVGETTASSDPVLVRPDDAYTQADDNVTVTITNTSGGNFESLDTSSSVTTVVTDDADVTTVTLNDVTVSEDGTATYTASVNNAPQGAFSVTLNNGVVINFANGALTGSSEPQAAQGDDPYVDAGSFQVSIASTSGGNFESLNTASTATVSITDTTDVTTVSLSTANVNEDDASVTFTATLSNASQGTTTVVTDLGQITIADGQSSGTLVISTQDSDVYKDASSLTATITSATGGNFEQLDIATASATAQITDTKDDTTVSLTATASITEAGTVITYTANLTNPADVGSDVTVNLSNGETITIAGGTSSGSVNHTVTADEDVYVDPTSVSAKIESATGGNFENLLVDGTPAVTSITDTIDTVFVDLSASTNTAESNQNFSVTFTATLRDSTNPAQENVTVIVTGIGTITILAEGTALLGGGTADGLSGSITVNNLNLSDERDYNISSASGGNFENLMPGNGATISVTDSSPTIALADVSVYNVEGSSAPAGQDVNFDADGPGQITLSMASGSDLPNGYDLLPKVGVLNTWVATNGTSGDDLFEITLGTNPDGTYTGTYTFTLLSDQPPVNVPVDVDEAVANLATWYDQAGNITTNTNNVYSAVIEPTGNNPYRITVSGETTDKKTGVTVDGQITVSNNTLGVGGDDTIQSNSGDVYKLSFDNVTAQSTTLKTIDLSVAHLGHAETFEIRITGSAGNATISSADLTIIQVDSKTDQVTIDLADLKATIGDEIYSLELVVTNGVVKVTDFDVHFDVQLNVGDYRYDFVATIEDGDGTTATDNFTAYVMAGTQAGDTLTGGSLPDTMSGGAGDDKISTGGDNDVLIGGADNDQLTGGLGADVFKWELADAGNGDADTVTDFSRDEGDKLDLSALLGDGSEEYLSSHFSVAEVDGNLVVEYSASGELSSNVTQTITLENLNFQLLGLTDTSSITEKLTKLTDPDAA